MRDRRRVSGLVCHVRDHRAPCARRGIARRGVRSRPSVLRHSVSWMARRSSVGIGLGDGGGIRGSEFERTTPCTRALGGKSATERRQISVWPARRAHRIYPQSSSNHRLCYVPAGIEQNKNKRKKKDAGRSLSPDPNNPASRSLTPSVGPAFRVKACRSRASLRMMSCG